MDIWELLRADVRAKAGLDNETEGGDANGGGGGGSDIALKLGMGMLHLQTTSGSRCCNLC